MPVSQVSLCSIHRASIAIFLVSALTACGGSSGTSEPEQTGQNTPPEITAPASLTLSYTGIPSVVALQLSDAENNSIRVSWAVNSSPTGGDMVIEPLNNFQQANISATVVGEYEVGVQATDGIDSSFKAIKIQVTNIAPVVAGVVIEPDAPNANSGATATHNLISDADEDSLDIDYFWRINNSDPVESATPYLSPSLIKRGDSISVEVVVTDGANEVRAMSPEAVVANAAPQASSITIEPSDAGSGDDLSARISNQTDADGDQINSSFQWFLNDVPLSGQNSDVLPARIAKPTDTVKIEVTLTDSIDSAVFTSAELLVLDSPSYLVVEPATVVISYGSPFNFTVQFVDGDGDDVQTELGVAPGGLTYNAATATASWTPTPVMTTQQENFTAQFTSSDGQTESVQITVQNDQNTPLLARSGIPIPASDFELDIGDFDGDGRAEVLSTNSRELIFTLEFDGESIMQDWLYPFSVAPGETILRLWAYGTDLSQVLVVTTRGVSLIESRSELPTRILDTTYNIAATSLNDFDADGVNEVLLISPQGVMSKLRTSDWSLAAFGQTLNATEWPSDHYSIAVGNVDDDPALEIVVDTGQVIDGATGEIQWTHISPFGSLITIGDVDGDGDTDIVASNRWQNVTSYDPIAQTSIWTYDINDFCSLRLYNVDSDPQDELIAGPCQHGSVEIYDGSSGTMVLQNDIDDPAYNSSLRSYSLGDLDNDGVDELIFSTGSGSTAEDNMAVVSLASLGDSTPGVVVNVNPSQISGFKSIGWDTTTTAQDRAVFVLPETEGGGDGQRVGLLSTSGEFVVSNVVAANWEDVAAGVVVDSNADGISEAVVGVGNVRDGEVHHLTLDDFSQTHLHTELGATESYLQPEIVSMSLGIDSDMSPKAIIATDQSKLQVYDIASTQADWTSGGLSGGNLREAIAINMDSGFDIVAATGTELTLWKKSGIIYEKSSTAGVECSFIRQVEINGADKIACALSDVWREETKVTLFSSELIKEVELDFDYAVTAIKSTPDGELLIGATDNMGSSFNATNENTLRTINPGDGTTIWKSAPLLGEINEISFSTSRTDGTAIMAVSTSSAMYILE